jgi:3-hydroxyisobutyrate dehydrogenase
MLFDTTAAFHAKPEPLEAMPTDRIWVQSGTLGPEGTLKAAEGATRMLDAPVRGSREPAEAGTLVTLVSGHRP